MTKPIKECTDIVELMEVATNCALPDYEGDLALDLRIVLLLLERAFDIQDREVAARALEKAAADLPQRYDDEDGNDTWLIEPDHLLARAAKLRAGGEKG